MFKSIGLFSVAALMSQAVLADDPITFTPVESNDFVGEYYPGTQPGYGVIVVEGARGGMPDLLAQKMATTGYPVLSVAYFKEPRLPGALEELPLEYLQKPKQWLLAQAETRDDGLVIAGWSKGAELTLSTVARDGDYKGAIAIAPTAVVWQGRGPAGAAASSWTYKNEALPYLTWPTPSEEQSINEAVLSTLATVNWQTHEARIPLEHTQATVLLLSGGQDSVWPATEMAKQICEQMQVTLPNRCNHIDYPGAGHLLHDKVDMGGTDAANVKADEASQQVIEHFLRDLNTQ